MTVVGTTTPVALHTDRHELSMLDAAVRSGTVDRPCVFETFTRRRPPGRRFGVAAGLGRLVEAVTAFRFDDAALAFLDDADVVAPVTLRWLAGFRFRGDIHAYREGEVYVPGSPALTITAPFGESVVRKGVDGGDGYSGCSVRDPVSGDESATELGRLLDEAGIRRVVVVGLAGDVCVRATALDAAARGLRVVVPLAATRMVELQSGDGDRAVADLRTAGVQVVAP